MHPDPGRALLEGRLAELSPAARVAIGSDLRSRGHALVWDQLDRAGIADPVERFLFLLDRLYPEMPPEHREQLSVQVTDAHAAGTWDGPVRPGSHPGSSGGR